jgi:hypothetical protein
MSEDTNQPEQEPNEEIKTEEPSNEITDDQSSLPLFLRNSSEGAQGNAQDEKDASSE